MDEGELADRENGVHFRATMRRMKQSSSGRPSTQLCIDCDEEIPRERLEAMAKNNLTCERCIACQMKAESWI